MRFSKRRSFKTGRSSSRAFRSTASRHFLAPMRKFKSKFRRKK